MRKKIKKELFTILDTIGEAHNEIGVLYKKKDWSSVIDLLTSCQEAAISIGTSIEESEGEGTNTVALLEGYCEFLYEVSVSIQESQDYNIDKALKGLNKKCLLIINSLKNEVPVKLEAVFLPYKASMWDSLESVWMDADADPECDAFVVPIPYFDKRSDGSLGEMHDESGLYPKNVPITSWQEYSIEQRLPDMIFIHNPYDGCNKVTTVHPNFYASNLKKYTNMLVYIPYFICYNDYVMEHFCTLPGTIHANKVVLQPLRCQYIRKKYHPRSYLQQLFDPVSLKTFLSDNS